MATYKQVQEYVKITYHFTPKTCWIAHVKELNGLRPRMASNRLSSTSRKHPCPNEKRDAIEKALRHYGMI